MINKFAITHDSFLGGKLIIDQPKEGYRAGNDPVLLAASLPLKPGQTLLDLGCGVGTAFLCALAREKSLKVTGVELQKKLSNLAKINSVKNMFSAEIITSNIDQISNIIGDKKFDHVIFNPPYFDCNRGTGSKSREKLVSNFAEEKELGNWLRIGMKKLKPKGTISLIARVESITMILKTLEEKVGSIRILPISSFKDVPCSRIIVAGKLGSKGMISIQPPLIMHMKALNKGGKDAFSKVAKGILFKGSPIDFSGY